MSYLVLGGIGCLIGFIGFRQFGWLFGMALGFMAAEIISLRSRVFQLEKKAHSPVSKPETIEKVDAGTPEDEELPDLEFPDHVFPEDEAMPGGVMKEHPQENGPAGFETTPPPAYQTVDDTGTSEKKEAATKKDADTKATAEDWIRHAFGYLKTFFTTGNVVTKIGVIVLFFGFAFLLKYAAQRSLIPIEFRLMGVFMVGLAMLCAGWRLRGRKLKYGLLLQGGGVGVLYLTVYAAARFYHLLPYGFSFAVMFCLVVLSGILAVLQNEKSLAITGIVGGFLAPVLVSTGSGSHVVLFSYYALLNLGIVGIAWKRAWRELNVIGFYFTFVIASIWGGKYYQPRHFSTTEPFLVLFFLYYVAISILYALRQRPKLKGYVDGTLVFALPVISFGLQYGLVRNFEYGLAISAMVLGLFYIALATLIWRSRKEDLEMMAESFLALGIVFGSLAIPLALDGRWTSAAWAIEGGAILWVGVRQKRFLHRLFGVLLQVGSGIFFLASMHLPYKAVPLANSFFVGCILISFAGLFSSWYLEKNKGRLHKWEIHRPIPFLVWGLAWWFGAAFVEIDRFLLQGDRIAVLLVHVAASFVITDMLSRRLSWKQFAYPSILLLPVMVLIAVFYGNGMGDYHLFARLGAVAWLLAFSANYLTLFKCETVWPEKSVSLWHLFSFWLLVFVLTRESAYYVKNLLEAGWTWQYCAWGAVPGTLLLALLRKGGRLSWPVGRFHSTFFGPGTAVLLFYLLLWIFIGNLSKADPSPLGYLPVLNPLEITQIYLFMISLGVINGRKFWPDEVHGRFLRTICYIAGFLVLNAMVARTVHFWCHVPYTPLGLYQSVLFQASISILWGLTALGTTLRGARNGSRPAWIAGASILTLVVIKLFVVDLSGTGTIARIISFIGVGSLMLLIGYFSPLPPATNREDS
jgi:uncharacterized membrane protein